MPLEAPTPEEQEMLPGGEFIAPDVSPEVRDFIQACRRFIYGEEFKPIIEQALVGAESMSAGVAPILLQIMTRAEDKLGPLSDEDFLKVAIHLAGTMVTTAQILNNPLVQSEEDAEDMVHEIVGVMNEMVDAGEDASEGEEAEEMPEEDAPPGTMAQIA